MKPEVAEALAQHAEERRGRLQAFEAEQRKNLLSELIYDFFVEQRNVLLKWSALTGQSAQIDTGYIAQHMASVVLAEPGQGFKGKGVDLANGGEVKSAALLSGVDRPRWNHDLGTLASDQDRGKRGLVPKWQGYLESPVIFYVLFDRAPRDPSRLRVRAWAVQPETDKGWFGLVQLFVDSRGAAQYNFQLHPPIGRDDDLVVNTLGNLDFADVKVFEADFALPGPGESYEHFEINWVQEPSDAWKQGETSAMAYSRSKERRIELEGAEGHVLPTDDEVRRSFRAL